MAEQAHEWQSRTDGRGVQLQQRQCGRCDAWETDQNRSAECRRPKVRIL